LSSDENFIIFYTDTGDSKISDDAAKELADKLVNSVGKIKKEFGYDFKYNPINNNGTATVNLKMRSVLKANNIDYKYVFTTLPVYVYFGGGESNSEAKAYYTPGIEGYFDGLFVGMFSDVAHSVFSLPFMVVKPDSILEKTDMELILAHELFHHYQSYIYGDGNYKKPKIDLFTLETTANLVAATIVEVESKDTILHKHLGNYLEKTNERFDNPNVPYYGYNSFTFLKVYSDIVPNGKNIVMESIKVKGTSTSYTLLDYLNEKAGSKMMEVMETLAEKNLTNDYDHGAMKGKYKPAQNGSKLGSGEYAIQDYTEGLTINYYYLDMKKYKTEVEIIIYTTDNNKELAKNASVLIMGSKNNYQLLSKYSLTEDIVLNTKDYSGYDEIAIVIAVGNIPSSVYYTIQIAEKGLDETPQIPDPESDEPDLLIAECVEIDLRGQSITNERLKELVDSGEIPKNTTVLRLDENEISDILPLGSLTDLGGLSLGYNQISDISPLGSLTGLKVLHLYHNQISDITPLRSLTNLEVLDSEYNQIGDISPLQSLTGLLLLNLGDNEISDLSPLRSLTNLQGMALNSNQISEIAPLQSLTDLLLLNLGDNEISDLSPLGSLTDLQQLALNSNQISDIAPLQSLTNLQQLSLKSNQISDVTPLKSLTSLEILNLYQNPLTEDQIHELWRALPNCEIRY
jgi:Leucine-rich repeat (LRR) protein